MEILKKIFAKTRSQEEPPHNEPQDVMKIANIVGPVLDGVVHNIFMAYRMELLAEPITYIVPAVWGAKKEGELTPVQKDIHARVTPAINKTFESLQINNLRSDQEFALDFLIRGIIISKITYMIEAFRSRLNERSMDEQSLKEALLRFTPVGSA